MTAWIEINKCKSAWRRKSVAVFMTAWIEIEVSGKLIFL